MYLKNKILVNNEFNPENRKPGTNGSNYECQCLAETDIDFHIEDWKKLATKEVLDEDILYVQHCNIPEHKLLEKYPKVKTTKDLSLATKFVISDQLLSRIYNFSQVKTINFFS